MLLFKVVSYTVPNVSFSIHLSVILLSIFYYIFLKECSVVFNQGFLFSAFVKNQQICLFLGY